MELIIIHHILRHQKNEKTWEHLDQSDGHMFKCIQGQVVLANSESSFLCTPKSHLKFNEILDSFGVRHQNKNWIMFNESQKKRLRKIFKDKYQIPIIVKKGSLIIWTSSTIHSARIQENPENKDALFI